MKVVKTKKEAATVRLPRKGASYTELSNFFDRHDGIDLLDRGIMEIDPDHEDLERMLLDSEAQIRSAMNGHLCRCGTYPRIMTAIQRASRAMSEVNQ